MLLHIQLSDILDYSNIILPIIYYLVVIIMCVTLIRQNRAPIKTIAWLLVIIFIPIGGMLSYIFFGRYLKKERLFDDKKEIDLAQIKRMKPLFVPDVESLKNVESATEIVENIKIIKLLINGCKSKFTINNNIKILQNGPQTYESILNDLKEAKSFIHLEYYIIENGTIADKIKTILLEKASQGVEVRIIYDYVGSLNLSNSYINQLERGGVKILPFMPVRFGKFTSKLNYRNHRKIIVIDGQIGYTGGINIADKYIFGNGLGHWRDTHLRVTGDGVDSLHLTFITDWYYLSGFLLQDEQKYFPKKRVKGNQMMQVITSGPDSEHAYIMDAYFVAITSAKKSIYISTPYFLPTQGILQALKTAALSGIEVKIIMPYKADSPVVSLSTKSYVRELLESGIKVYLYKEGFTHAKVLIVDELLSSIGTANVDFRSFEQNLEVNAIIYDRGIAKELTIEFNRDIEKSKMITLGNWTNRRKSIKILESFARIFAPLF